MGRSNGPNERAERMGWRADGTRPDRLGPPRPEAERVYARGMRGTYEPPRIETRSDIGPAIIGGPFASGNIDGIVGS